jgi:type IX secretion system PorP/SprF family membrane protein
MMRKIFNILFILFCVAEMQAQQAVQYSQFMLNDYVQNPAVAGSNKGLLIMVGRRTQWRGFAYAPESNFASITKDYGKKGYRRYWHGVGAYVEQDKFGIFSTKSAYASYAIHLKLSAKYYLSFGIAGGIKSVALSPVFDANDPALLARSQKVLLPDFTPGLYLYSKKISIGISLKNIYKNALKQGSKEIGTNGRLAPTLFFSLNRKYRSSGYDFVFVPGINVQSNFLGIPSAQANFMAYYRQRVGLGVSYRAHDAVSAIIQIRILKNVLVGFAYDYTVSKFRAANANSMEFMMGFSPVMASEEYRQPNGAADCPKFEFDF